MYIHGKANTRMLLLLYVDDISLAFPRTVVAVAADIKAKLATKYKITNLGAAKQFLSIQITNDDDGIALGQPEFFHWHDPETVRHGGSKRRSCTDEYQC